MSGDEKKKGVQHGDWFSDSKGAFIKPLTESNTSQSPKAEPPAKKPSADNN
jgi:hypothetical protein